MATAVGVELLGGQKLALPQGYLVPSWHQFPAEHGLQRALDESVVLASNVPGAHGCLVSQNGCPGTSWNLPEGQISQTSALLTLEKYISGHLRQRALDTSVALASNVPGAHGCLLSQYGCPSAPWLRSGWRRPWRRTAL